MSGSLVTLLIVLASCVAVTLPLLAVRSRRAILPVVAIAGTALLAVLFLYANPFSGSIAANRSTATLEGDADFASQCANVVDLARQGGIILEYSNPSRPVVSRTIWSQMPQEIRQGIEVCLDTVRPANMRENPVEVIQR